MRHKYATRAIVLGRSPAGEANASLALLTRELGLVRARAQGLRKSGAKLAPALATLAESEVILVRGAEGWRLAGAALVEPWFGRIPARERERAGRLAALSLRLISGEVADERLFDALAAFLAALAAEEDADAAEIRAALALLAALGLDAGELPADLERAASGRASYISRINRGIEASGL
ncbi:MAG TPA: recombination protein O N-terminal domain-containing protein [Candidatus Paceibacterota bacterium]|nr:recombination protein O N-terminal domain-containing protein [Candidatus Paceibacterota bacterium]